MGAWFGALFLTMFLGYYAESIVKAIDRNTEAVRAAQHSCSAVVEKVSNQLNVR